MVSSDLPQSCSPTPVNHNGARPDVRPSGAIGAPVRVRDQGELIAGLPALIGFHPHGSLVLVSMGGESGKRVGLTLRVDLPPPEHEVEIGDVAVPGLLLDDPAGAVVVIVAGRGDPPHAGPAGASPPGGAGLPHRRLAEHVGGALAERGVEVHAVLWAESTTAGSPWRCYDSCGCSGLVPDAGSSAVLAAAVAGGQVVRSDRAALERLVAPADDERIGRREELLVQAVERELAGEPELPDLAPVLTAIADAQAGRLELDDERVVQLAIALTAPAVRDAALLRCAGPDGAGAEQLWAALARETPDPEAAEPAALLAVSALLRGDGALANVALDRAERAWPGHNLTGLLRRATQAGVRPAEVRAWLGECSEPRAGSTR
jgi:hypothetical protein